MADDVRPRRDCRCCSDLDAVELAANRRADQQAPEWIDPSAPDGNVPNGNPPKGRGAP